ncbi:hypothetical protein Trydic_g20866 [Trypoxylus dichotomus]
MLLNVVIKRTNQHLNMKLISEQYVCRIQSLQRCLCFQSYQTYWGYTKKYSNSWSTHLICKWLLLCLQVYSTENHLQGIADLAGMHVSTVCEMINVASSRVTGAINCIHVKIEMEMMLNLSVTENSIFQ